MDTIHGLPQVRAMGKESYFEQQFHRCQDKHTSVSFLYFNSYRWMGTKIEWLVTVLLVVGLIVAIRIGSWGENAILQ